MSRFINGIMCCIICIVIISCQFEVTTAYIDEVSMCTILSNESCDQDTNVFEITQPYIYITCNLKNAPENTEVTFVWKYIESGNEIIIDEVTLDSSDKGTNLNLSSNISKPYNNWPVGMYKVDILVSGDNSEPWTKFFEVK